MVYVLYVLCIEYAYYAYSARTISTSYDYSLVVCMSRILSMYTCTLEYYVHHDVFIRNECEGRYGWELAAVSGQDAGRQQCTLVEYDSHMHGRNL